MSEDYQIKIADKNFKKNLKLNEEYPANVWTFAHVNLYNDYFIPCPPKDSTEKYNKRWDFNSTERIFSPENYLLTYHNKRFFDIQTKELSLSNRERSKIKDKSMIIGSRYRFYIPLIDKSSDYPWVIYADPTMLFLNNPRSIIENLDPSKTVYVCKHDNYTTKKQTKTLIPSINYPFNVSIKDFFELLKYLNENPEHYFNKGRNIVIETLKELYSSENFEKFEKLFAQRDLSQDDFMKACLAIFKDKKNYMLRNKHIASEQVLEEIYQRWYVSDEMESFDNFDYDRKNWSSFMIFNKEKFNLKWRQLDSYSIEDLHQFKWCTDEEIGELPLSWNHLVDEQEDISNPNALNFTVDSPGRYKSNSTSKLNQKYININLAQILCLEELPFSTPDENAPEDEGSYWLDVFEKTIKYILDLTPKKLESACEKLNIKNFSPLEVLYTQKDAQHGFGLADLQYSNNVKDPLPSPIREEHLTKELDNEVNKNYNQQCAVHNGYNIEFYVQNCYDSKNKIKEMMKILQEQIKNLSENDKKEIVNIMHTYNLTAQNAVLGTDTFHRDKCLSIRELTGRLI